MSEGQLVVIETGRYKNMVGYLTENHQKPKTIYTWSRSGKELVGKRLSQDLIQPYLINVYDHLGKLRCVVGAGRLDGDVTFLDGEGIFPLQFSLNTSGRGKETINYHILPENSKGLIEINYDMYGYPDGMEVSFFRTGGIVASTDGQVANEGSLRFRYDSTVHNNVLMVRVYSDSDGTAWEYSVDYTEEPQQ